MNYPNLENHLNDIKNDFETKYKQLQIYVDKWLQSEEFKQGNHISKIYCFSSNELPFYVIEDISELYKKQGYKITIKSGTDWDEDGYPSFYHTIINHSRKVITTNEKFYQDE